MFCCCTDDSDDSLQNSRENLQEVPAEKSVVCSDSVNPAVPVTFPDEKEVLSVSHSGTETSATSPDPTLSDIEAQTEFEGGIMSADSLVNAVNRLESIATRLERLAHASPSGGEETGQLCFTVYIHVFQTTKCSLSLLTPTPTK